MTQALRVTWTHCCGMHVIHGIDYMSVEDAVASFKTYEKRNRDTINAAETARSEQFQKMAAVYFKATNGTFRAPYPLISYEIVNLATSLAGCYVLSSASHKASEWQEYVTNHKLGKITVDQAFRNPNSGHMVEVGLFYPDWTAIRAHTPKAS